MLVRFGWPSSGHFVAQFGSLWISSGSQSGLQNFPRIDPELSDLMLAAFFTGTLWAKKWCLNDPTDSFSTHKNGVVMPGAGLRDDTSIHLFMSPMIQRLFICILLLHPHCLLVARGYIFACAAHPYSRGVPCFLANPENQPTNL